MTKISPNYYVEAVEKIQKEAYEATTNLLKELKEKGQNYYIAFPEWEEQTGASFIDGYGNISSLSIFGVGLNDSDQLCVGAVVDNIGYGHAEDDFPQEWTVANALLADCYPMLYYFVADNIEKTITKECADKISVWYWSDEE